MNTETVIGICASTLTSAALLPQLVKIIKEKKGDQTSFAMLLILMTGLLLWIAYGVLNKDAIIMISNSFAVFINACTFLASYYYRDKNNG